MLPKIAHVLSWDCPEQCGPCHRWSPVNEVGEYVFCVGAYICGEVADSLAMSFTLLCGRVISLPCPYFVFRYTSRKDIAGQGF